MLGRRGNWLSMIRPSIVKVPSDPLAVAAVLAERNTNGVICKSKKARPVPY